MRMMSDHQITIVSLDQLVSENHQYRKFKKLGTCISLIHMRPKERKLGC
jgi:hypothetical protein